MKFDLASGFGKLHSQKENPRPHLKKKKKLWLPYF